MRVQAKPAALSFASIFSQQGEWNELKGKLKQKYAQLTDDDLIYAKGKEDELLGRLQKRLGQKQDDIRKLIAGL